MPHVARLKGLKGFLLGPLILMNFDFGKLAKLTTWKNDKSFGHKFGPHQNPLKRQVICEKKTQFI